MTEKARLFDIGGSTQHSCFVYEEGESVVTVYSKVKKRMRKYEVNILLDLAKADLLDKIRGK